jgi:hypothetical protein
VTTINGTYRESTTSGTSHTLTVPSGVTADMNFLIMIGSGSSSAFTSSLSAGGASFALVDERNAVNTRVAIWKGNGLVAGTTINITLSLAATLSIQHQYTDEYDYGTIAAAIRSVSSSSTTSGSLSVTTGQKVLFIGIERTTAGPTSVSSVSSSGGETINQIAFNEGGTVQTSVYYGTFVASGSGSRTATITYSDSSTNGFAALLGTTAVGGGGTGGGFTGSTPAAILNLGVGNGKNHFNLGIGYTSGHTDKTLDSLEAGFIDPPYLDINSAGNAVILSAPLNGGTTSSNTQYARCEFRELEEGGGGGTGATKASWIPSSGTHYVQNRTRVVKVPPNKPQVCVMQMHDSSDDTAMVLTQLISGTIRLVARINGSQIGVLNSNYQVGTEFQIMIKLVNGTLGFYYNDMTTPRLTSTTFSNSETGQYFKTGCYNQSNTSIDSLSDGPFITEMRELECWHTGYATPAAPASRPSVNAGADASVTAGTTFSRTVIESANGSTITSRSWKIQSGPTGVGTTIDTDQNLTWTPTIAGTYVLRYSATNANGTGTDDVTITVVSTPADPGTGGGGSTLYPAEFMDGTPYPTIIEGTTTVNVTSSSTLTSALAGATTGQRIVLANGTYSGSFTISGKSRVTIQAATTGSAVFSSGSTFNVSNCDNVTVRGLLFNFDTGGDVFQFRGATTNSRITRCTFGPSTHTESSAVSTYIFVGDNCQKIRIDHNEIRNKGTSGNGVRVYGNFDTFIGCKYVRIDHNIFRSIKPEVGNDKEPVRYGVSTMSRTDSFGVIERNVFLDCVCEPELTSVKMGSIRVSGNVYLQCAGGPVIRHGTGSILSDNYVIDRANTFGTTIGSGGFRFYDSGHKILHNYLDGISGSGNFQPSLLLDTGDAEGSSTNLSAHWRVVNAQVDRNVIVNSRTGIRIGDNYSSAPTGCSITNNVTAGITGGGTVPIEQLIAPVNTTISGNLNYTSTSAGGFAADTDGIFRKAGVGPRLSYIDTADVGPAGDINDTDGTGSTGTGGETGTTAPVVSAGGDFTALLGATFTRTATESGAGITSRTWRILSGPTGVGTILSQAAALSWTPTILGAYVLRYTATNTAGSGSDDVAVTVATGGGTITTPTFVGVGAGDSGTTTTVNLPAPAGVIAGDFQVAIIQSSGPETITAAPADWRLLDTASVTSPSTPTDRGGPSTSWVYYNTTGAQAAIFTKSGTRFWHGVRAAWRGQSALGDHQVTAEVSGAGSTSHVTPSVTPVRGNSRVVGIVMSDLINLGSGPFTPPAGWTERYDVTVIGGGVNAGPEYESITVADFGPDGGGTPPPSATINTLVGWGGNDGSAIPGVTNEVVGAFMGRETWANLANGDWLTDPAASLRPYVLSRPDGAAAIGVPLIPTDGIAESGYNAALDTVIAGTHDADHTSMGRRLAEYGPKTVYCRLWWEFNMDDTFIDHTKFKSAFQRAVPNIRAGFASAARTGQTIKIVFCSMPDRSNKEDMYPGNSVVDVLSYDVYGKHYGPVTLTKAACLAEIQGYYADLVAWGAANSKPIALDEWGNWKSRAADGVTDHRGYGDWPEYITATFDWAEANNVLYLCYFNEPGGGVGITINQQPNSLAVFQARAARLQT